jgi:hypothetical protein
MARAAYSKNVLASRIELTVWAAWSIEQEHRVKDFDMLGSLFNARSGPFGKTVSVNWFIITPKRDHC